MPTSVSASQKPPRAEDRHQRRSCGTVLAERKNKLENVNLEIKVNYLERERIRLKHNIKRNKKDLVKFVKLMKTTTGKHPDGVVSDVHDKQVCESEHFRFGYVINDKRLVQWRGKERLFERQMGNLQMEDKTDILDGCIELQKLIEEIRLENDPHRIDKQRYFAKECRPKSAASSKSSKIDVFESLRTEPVLPNSASASCPPEFSIRAWEESMINNYVSRASDDPRKVIAKDYIRPWSALELDTRAKKQTKKNTRLNDQSYPNTRDNRIRSAPSNRTPSLPSRRPSSASVASQNGAGPRRRTGVVIRPTSAASIPDSNISSVDSYPVTITSSSLLKELTDFASAEEDSEFEQVIVADEQRGISDPDGNDSEYCDDSVSQLCNNFVEGTSYTMSMSNMSEVDDFQSVTSVTISHSENDSQKETSVPVKMRRKSSLKKVSSDLSLDKNKPPIGRRSSRDLTAPSPSGSASSKRVVFQPQPRAKTPLVKRPKTFTHVPLSIKTVDINKGLPERSRDEFDYSDRQGAQWRRELLAEAPPGLYSPADRPTVRLAMSKSARRRELAKMVDENLASSIDELIITEKERQYNARTALQRSMKELESVSVTKLD